MTQVDVKPCLIVSKYQLTWFRVGISEKLIKHTHCTLQITFKNLTTISRRRSKWVNCTLIKSTAGNLARSYKTFGNLAGCRGKKTKCRARWMEFVVGVLHECNMSFNLSRCKLTPGLASMCNSNSHVLQNPCTGCADGWTMHKQFPERVTKFRIPTYADTDSILEGNCK